jgi:hypothetical protein
MPNFILNKNQQANGDYEVHNTTNGCDYMPDSSNQVALGWHSDCHGAVKLAQDTYRNARINGCYWCCNACHTT